MIKIEIEIVYKLGFILILSKDLVLRRLLSFYSSAKAFDQIEGEEVEIDIPAGELTV